jgi:hypothetical protein
MPVEF